MVKFMITVIVSDKVYYRRSARDFICWEKKDDIKYNHLMKKILYK